MKRVQIFRQNFIVSQYLGIWILTLIERFREMWIRKSGTKALGLHLAQAEVIFEYRSSDSSVPFQQRLELRRGFRGIVDELWPANSLRNDILHYQQGFFAFDIHSRAQRIRGPRGGSQRNRQSGLSTPRIGVRPAVPLTA